MLAIICVVAAAVVTFGGAIRRAFRRLSPRERILIEQREAARQVDDLFDQARVRMEEAAGRRRPGERHIQDGFGSWRSF
jgi:hypothetical protein